jgi:hypothetical protein
MSNITSGGKVHTGMRRGSDDGAVWYESRCGAGRDRTGTRQHNSFKVTESEVSCKTCLKITAAEQPEQQEMPVVSLEEVQLSLLGITAQTHNVSRIVEIIHEWEQNQGVNVFTFEGLLDFIASRHQLTR